MPIVRRGLLVSLYFSPNLRQCAAGGVTTRHEKFVLIDPTRELGPFEPDPVRCPALYLIRRDLGVADGTGKRTHAAPYLHAVPGPDAAPVGAVGPMMGGSFVYTSDARFPCSYPIPVHDRFETREQYASYD